MSLGITKTLQLQMVSIIILVIIGLGLITMLFSCLESLFCEVIKNKFTKKYRINNNMKTGQFEYDFWSTWPDK